MEQPQHGGAKDGAAAGSQAEPPGQPLLSKPGDEDDAPPKMGEPAGGRFRAARPGRAAAAAAGRRARGRRRRPAAVSEFNNYYGSAAPASGGPGGRAGPALINMADNKAPGWG